MYKIINIDKTFKNAKKISKVINNLEGDVILFYYDEEDGRIHPTNIFKKADGFICKDSSKRKEIAEYICKEIGIIPEPTLGNGGLDWESNIYGHLSRGSRRSNPGYNFGYAF